MPAYLIVAELSRVNQVDVPQPDCRRTRPALMAFSAERSGDLALDQLLQAVAHQLGDELPAVLPSGAAQMQRRSNL